MLIHSGFIAIKFDIFYNVIIFDFNFLSLDIGRRTCEFFINKITNALLIYLKVRINNKFSLYTEVLKCLKHVDLDNRVVGNNRDICDFWGGVRSSNLFIAIREKFLVWHAHMSLVLVQSLTFCFLSS